MPQLMLTRFPPPMRRYLLLVAGAAGTLRLVGLDAGGPRGRTPAVLPLGATPCALAVHEASRTLAVLCAPAARSGAGETGSDRSGLGAPGGGSMDAGSANERSGLVGRGSGGGSGSGAAGGDAVEGLQCISGQGGGGGGGDGVGREGDNAERAAEILPHELRCVDPATGAPGLCMAENLQRAPERRRPGLSTLQTLIFFDGMPACL